MQLPDLLKAVAYIKAMNGGGSRAQLVLGSDDEYYVIKLIGNPQGTRILANEYMTGKVAKLLNVPCPETTIMVVDETMIQHMNGTCGTQFGPGLQHAMAYLGGETIRVFPSNLDLMTKASNVDKWPNAIIFDTLVQNEDLGDRHILVAVDDNDTKFWHIDHGHTLGVTQGWASLRPEKVAVRNLYPSLVKGEEPFKDAFERLNAISKDAIEAALQPCPLDEWGVASSEPEGLVSYLMSARSKVQESIIASKGNWPNWK